MSQYRLLSPIDVKSSSSASPGTINIFNGGVNGTSLRAPAALTANRAFVLPSALGSSGSYIKYDGTNVSFGPGVANTTCLPINVELCNTNVSNSATTTSTTFLTIGNINWRGTAIEGTPSAVYIIVFTTTASGQVRLFNRNAATTAAIVSFGIVTGRVIISIPITGGFTVGADIIDIQIRRTAAPVGNINLSWLQIVP